MLLDRYVPSWLRRAVKRCGSIFGRIHPNEIDALVVWIYQLALDREPSPDERQFWIKKVLDGHLSVAGLAEAIATSAEVEARSAQTRLEISTLIVQVYQLALDRRPTPEERQFWSSKVCDQELSVAGLVKAIATSSEADDVRARAFLLPNLSNGRFIQFVYEHILGRGAMASEIVHWDYWMSHEDLARDRMVGLLFTQRVTDALSQEAEPTRVDPNLASVLGTDIKISHEEWQERADAIGSDAKAACPRVYPSLTFQRGPEILVSAIASLYKGGDYIAQFLDNITSQTIFESCELIIIDADSPENEFAVIAPYMERFPNIVYHRTPTRIGIYDAWNFGISMARGRYVTNTNLDDLRRQDSFERQAEILEKFPFVDVVYQDFYYSFAGKAPFSQTAAVGVQSKVPIVTPYNLMGSNSPHNAPMWRRALHKEVGAFDASYRSAGDYEFWLRCVKAGKVFYKINDPHVVYFVNPDGLSTKPDTRGLDEAYRITREHSRAIISPKLLSSADSFLAETSQALGSPLHLCESERAVPEWRYAVVQRAMRLCSVASRENDRN